jgi:invasion protein IalB
MIRTSAFKSIATGLFAAATLILISPTGEMVAQAQQQPTAQQQPKAQKAPPPGPRVQTLQQLQRLQQRRQQQGGAPQQPQQPPAEVIASHGKWQVQCNKIPAPGAQGAPETSGKANKGDAVPGAATPAAGAKPPTRQCGMVQIAKSPKRKGVTLTLILGKAPQGDKTAIMMRILVPVGVYLPLGIAMEVDGAPIGRVPFIRCLPQVCMAIAEATTETLAKMRKGSNVNFIIYEAPGVGITLPISLEGFTKSVEALKSS